MFLRLLFEIPPSLTEIFMYPRLLSPAVISVRALEHGVSTEDDSELRELERMRWKFQKLSLHTDTHTNTHTPAAPLFLPLSISLHLPLKM